MTLDGLRCTGGAEAETPLDASERGGVVRLPLVWTHPVTGRCALMPHTRCLEALEVYEDEVVAGSAAWWAWAPDRPPCEVIPLDEARAWLHALTRRAVEPPLVYAHAWAPRDVVLWDNLGVWHSATGGLREGDRRVMHLHAFDGSTAPALLPSGD